jgi:hypothetical protein
MSQVFNDAQGKRTVPSSGFPLGAIVGIVIGLILIIAVSLGAAFYLQRRRALQQKPDEDEPDPTTTFYNDNKTEADDEYALAFENPVFDTNATGVEMSDGDVFDEDPPENVEL